MESTDHSKTIKKGDMKEGRKEAKKEKKINKKINKKKLNHYKLLTKKCIWEKCRLRFVEAEETHV